MYARATAASQSCGSLLYAHVHISCIPSQYHCVHTSITISSSLCPPLLTRSPSDLLPIPYCYQFPHLSTSDAQSNKTNFKPDIHLMPRQHRPYAWVHLSGMVHFTWSILSQTRRPFSEPPTHTGTWNNWEECYIHKSMTVNSSKNGASTHIELIWPPLRVTKDHPYPKDKPVYCVRITLESLCNSFEKVTKKGHIRSIITKYFPNSRHPTYSPKKFGSIYCPPKEVNSPSRVRSRGVGNEYTVNTNARSSTRE